MTDAPERIWVSETPGQNLPYPEERRGSWTTNVGQYGNQVEYIRADLCRPEPQGWQPIETAPKDGTMVLLYRPSASYWGKVAPGKWASQELNKRPQPFWEIWLKIGGAIESRGWPPTHWMPLPEPPKP